MNIRAVLPRTIRRPIRRILDAVGARRRMSSLRLCVSALRQQAAKGMIDPNLLASLRKAWGNETFSVDQSFLAAVAGRAIETPSAILDCGSGLSTVVEAVIAGVCGGHVWSLEQDRDWYEQTKRVLADLKLTAHVSLWYAPLRRYEDFVWFDIDGRELPGAFTLVVCDGPAVFESEWSGALHANWRAGVVPVLRARGIRFGDILLDDAEDPRCGHVRDRWMELGVSSDVMVTPTGSFVLGREERGTTAHDPSPR